MTFFVLQVLSPFSSFDCDITCFHIGQLDGVHYGSVRYGV